MYFTLPYLLLCVGHVQSLDLYRFFPEEALSISMHPTGLFLLVGFADKLRLMNILMDDIREFKSWPLRNCVQVGRCLFPPSGS